MGSPLSKPLGYVDLLERIVALASRLRHLRGRLRLATAAALGAVSALAYAPFHLWPALFATLPALTILIDGTGDSRRPWLAAGLVGWMFGFCYFLVGLHWVGYAFVVDAEQHAWLLPFVAVLFPGGLALFIAAAAALARLRWSNDWSRVALLAAAICAFEWLRGHILTGFPWNLPGYVWSASDPMFQAVSVFGVYGLSLLTLVSALAPAAVINADGTLSNRIWPLGVSAAILAALLAFGWARLPAGASPSVPNMGLRIVQPNVPQAEKWKPELMERNWRLLVENTLKPGLASKRLVIWPEAAPPFLMLQEPDGLQVVAQILPEETTLLTGVVRSEAKREGRRFFNSMAAIDGQGGVLAVYDKAHLVPFGEYLPLWRLLEPLGITKLTGGSGGYTEGRGRRTLAIPGTPSFGPLICYEVIFPGEVVDRRRRPEWLVTMTDDSWFGPWAGPYQHLGIAKVRAAEEGLPIIRAANTGVSAVIDPYGRIGSSLALNETGFLDAELPEEVASTTYSLLGDSIFAVLVGGLTYVGLFFYRTAQKGS